MFHFAAPRPAFLSLIALALISVASAQIPTPVNQAGKQASNQASPASQAPASAKQDAPRFLRYVRAGATGARARNVYDKQGLVVLEVPAGGLLAVHGERSGWYEVEAPGGFSVWVWGQYLAPTADANVLQVSGANVNMRPLPSNDVSSLPLGQVLEKGDRVRVIGRKDASKPLSDDWVNVWSRAGVRAWVHASETEPLPSDVDGSARWAKSVLEARPTIARDGDAATLPSNGNQRDGQASTDELKAENKDVGRALADADALLAAARKLEHEGGTPDYVKARAAYEKVLTLAPTSATADVARGRIELCKGYAEAHELRAELERKRDTVDAAVKKREVEMERARNRGVYEGRFGARGWLEERTLPGDQVIYILRWAGDPHAELVCTSGRYDLSLFVDYELGINGNEIRGPVTAPTVELTRPRELDVTRLEVLAGRNNTKR